MKNVIAIACGFAKGRNLGENAKAAIITRGMSEIVKLGVNMGAKRKTFYDMKVLIEFLGIARTRPGILNKFP